MKVSSASAKPVAKPARAAAPSRAAALVAANGATKSAAKTPAAAPTKPTVAAPAAIKKPVAAAKLASAKPETKPAPAMAAKPLPKTADTKLKDKPILPDVTNPDVTNSGVTETAKPAKAPSKTATKPSTKPSAKPPAAEKPAIAAKAAAKPTAAAPKAAAPAAAPKAASSAPTMADLVREAARAHIAEGGTNKPIVKPAPKPVVVAKPPEPPEPKPEVRIEPKMSGPIQHNGRPPQISRASNKDESFAQHDYVVYPTHGVGKVEKIAVEEIAGHKLELIHITFEENRMTLRVPVAKARSAGLRKLATRKLFDEALAVLKGRARIKRTMWSRRAQEYEAKINSGDPLSIAEVVRDLHRNSGQPDQSFSERQIYEAALERLAAELGALEQIDKLSAIVKLTQFLKAL